MKVSFANYEQMKVLKEDKIQITIMVILLWKELTGTDLNFD